MKRVPKLGVGRKSKKKMLGHNFGTNNGQPLITGIIKSHRVRWAGHVASPIRQVLDGPPDHGFDGRITFQQMRVGWGPLIGGFRARIGSPGEQSRMRQ